MAIPPDHLQSFTSKLIRRSVSSFEFALVQAGALGP